MIIMNYSLQSYSSGLQWCVFYAVYALFLMVATGTEESMLRGPGSKCIILVAKKHID